MNYLDIIIAIPLMYGLIKGFANGLIKEVTGLLGLLIGVYVAINFSEYLIPKFTEYLSDYEKFVPIIAFGVLFLVSVIIIKILGYIINRLTNALALGIISRLLGSVFGVLKIVIIFSFLLFVETEYDFLNNKAKKESVLYEPLIVVAEHISPQIKKHKTILDKIESKTEKAKSKLKEKFKTQ